MYVLLFGRGPELGLPDPSRDTYPGPLLRVVPLLAPGHERGAGFRLASGLPEAPGLGALNPAAGRLATDRAAGRGLPTLR